MSILSVAREKKKITAQTLLLQYLRPQGKIVLLLVLLVLGGIALQLLNPQLIRQFLDGVEAGRALEALIKTAVLFTVIAIAAQLLQLAAAYLGQQVAWTATNNLRADLAEHCLNLDLAFHKKNKPGELIERVDGDVNQLTNFFAELFIQLSSNLLLLAGIVVLLWLVDWRIGVTIAAIGIVGLFALQWINRAIVARWEKVRAVSSELFGYLEEWLSGLDIIKSNGGEPYILRRLYQLQRRRLEALRRAMIMNMGVNGIPLLIPALAYMAAYLWGAELLAAKMITIGTVYLIVYYIDLLRNPLWQIQRQIQDLQQATASLNRVLALLNQQPQIVAGDVDQLSPQSWGVRFKDVDFQYETGDELVLQEIDFALQPGRTLGLIGRTGSGKSTITRLLFRFYDPTAGQIELVGENGDQIPLPQLSFAALRRHIGLVTQEVELFHASVRDNLTLFDDSISDERLLETLAQLGLAAWIKQMPEGLDTRLAANSGLSAGEAQLLALARVFLVDPAIVILDEASSRLDPVTEQLLEQAIDTLLADRTAIIIAHRLHTIRRADEMLLLDNGRIAEHGSRQELAADPNSRFAKLLQTGLEAGI